MPMPSFTTSVVCFVRCREGKSRWRYSPTSPPAKMHPDTSRLIVIARIACSLERELDLQPPAQRTRGRRRCQPDQPAQFIFDLAGVAQAKLMKIQHADGDRPGAPVLVGETR